MTRALSAGIAFLAAAGSGVLSALVAAKPSLGLWVAVGVLIIVGTILQVVATAGERRSSSRVLASGPGAVAVGGSAGQVETRVRGHFKTLHAADVADISASAPGAVSIGGVGTGPITTNVTDTEDDKHQ